ncbi:GTPase-activating protein, partial [Ascoidea rubescens DSM 1968]
DRYGFKKKTQFVSEDEYNQWWIDYEVYLSRRKKKWEIFMKQNGLSSYKNDNPIRFPTKSNKLKKYIRKGIPAEWRGNAWWFYAKGSEKLNANIGLYDKIIENTLNIKNQDTEIIERDLNRTFPDNLYFKNDNFLNLTNLSTETPLVQALRRVLTAFAAYQPQIGYCQSLNFIAGLLLIFMDEEKSFWMLVIITTKLLPGVHDVNLEGVNIDQGVLMLCLKEYLPNIWEKIGFDFNEPSVNKQSKKKTAEVNVRKLPPITLCTASWFMSCFIGIVPIESTLRIWDCFFYEESKIFIKMALTIFKLCEPKILKMKDEMEVFQLIQNYPKKLIDVNTLFDTCFKKRNGYNHISQDEINRCRKFVKDQRRKTNNTGYMSSKNGSLIENGDVNGNESYNILTKNEELLKFTPEIYDFKKNGLVGVHWNHALTKKMKKQMIKRK